MWLPVSAITLFFLVLGEIFLMPPVSSAPVPAKVRLDETTLRWEPPAAGPPPPVSQAPARAELSHGDHLIAGMGVSSFLGLLYLLWILQPRNGKPRPPAG